MNMVCKKFKDLALLAYALEKDVQGVKELHFSS